MSLIKGIILDPLNRKKFNGAIEINDGRIIQVHETGEPVPQQFILPGFVDSHIHIESSMLVPSEFARLAVRHGTVATVSDPHEIANVCGIEGINFMINNGEKVPFKFFFGAPSCVPATPFETSGAVLDSGDVDKLLERDDILYLAEMMNWPGVLSSDEEVTAKIRSALKRGKPVDGHAPGLKGERARAYAKAGISTDHECYTKEEAIDKLNAGMKIAIREGSAAKNYEALISLLGESPENIMFCSDDKHPDDLLFGHINELAARSLQRGFELFDTLRACSVNPVKHYKLPVGLLQMNDPADFIIVKDLDTMQVSETWISGECVYANRTVHLPHVKFEPINNFVASKTEPSDFAFESDESGQPVIIAQDGELITGMEYESLPVKDGYVQPDPDRDILKITVVNRYQKTEPSVGFIKNFGLQKGAFASSVAHDSHNIVAIGTSDKFLSDVVNMVMQSEGGIAAIDDNRKEILPLPVGGIMSDQPGEIAASKYERLSFMVKEMGSTITSPFMLISFMALLVIPRLKISDKGLFDGEKFEFVRQG
jgi:adenine deaminase